MREVTPWGDVEGPWANSTAVIRFVRNERVISTARVYPARKGRY